MVPVFSPLPPALTCVAAVPVSSPVLVVVLVSAVLLVPYANQYWVVALLAVTVAFRVALEVLRLVATLVVTVGAVAIV